MPCAAAGLDDLLSSSATVGYWRFYGCDSLADGNYLQYLREAHEVVGACALACQVWSAPYDGLRPSPEDYLDEEEERQQRELQERRLMEREREEDGVLPFISSSQVLSPAPASVPIYVLASAADGNSGGQSAAAAAHGLLELEWDDMFESGMESGEGELQAVKAVDPPQHLVEMRRSAISLIQGSYVEEAEFQDDVLVYTLIAQRDSHTHTHARPHARAHTHAPGTAQVSANSLTHHSSTHTTVQSARIRPRKAAATAQTDSNTHSHTPTDTQNVHRDSHTLTTVQCARTHSYAHTHQQTEIALTNGLGPDMDHSGDELNAKTIINTQDCVQNGLDYNSHLPRDRNSQHPQDFVSQCLELIQSLGWEAERIMGDEEFCERVQRLSLALQEEVELRFEDPEPLKLPEVDLTKIQNQGQDAPFTGLVFVHKD